MAEFVRVYHNVSPDETHRIIVDVVSKDIPVIQEFDGFPRILKELRASDYILVLLYWCGSAGTTGDELLSWVRPKMRANLMRTINQLDQKPRSCEGELIKLTRKGEQHVEDAKLVEPA